MALMSRIKSSSQENILRVESEDDSESSDDSNKLPVVQGFLCKWTNYIHGWQDRYIVCKDGTLSYYKTPDETCFGCRGAISLAKATLTPHKLDDCRFDVVWGEQIWYLRADNNELRHMWLKGLEEHRAAENGYGSENNLRRHNSLLSITSGASQSNASASSFKRGHGLSEKINEMEHFREILCKQVDTLQSYFDLCANLSHDPLFGSRGGDTDEVSLSLQSTQIKVDAKDSGVDANINIEDSEDIEEDCEIPRNSGGFLGIGSFFRRSRGSTVTNLPSSSSASGSAATPNSRLDLESYHKLLSQHGAHSVDFKGEAITFKATTAGIIAQLSNTLELMVQREENLRRRLEKELERRKRLEEAYRGLLYEKPKTIVMGGPDFEEGPECTIREEEFFDAIDAQLDKMELNNAQLHALHSASFSESVLETNHPLFEEISRICLQHIESADFNIEDPGALWELIEENGDMMVYHREVEEDGITVDPLLAVHCVPGFTAQEFCEIFWDLKYRLDWEDALDAPPQLLESVSADTVVVRQIYKRVWPAAQREAVFWSRIFRNKDVTIVVNYSTDYAAPSITANKTVRLKINVAMMCQTLTPANVPREQLRREDLRCKIRYSAFINPGGWAPARVVRAITRKEGPKFLKRFTQFVEETTRDRPIKF